ncbi:MAG TPA: hypothetical protein VFM61_00120 [Pseudidiomarina sp.]|nr:hypothetical protein [Pseudidiomarina sp.]
MYKIALAAVAAILLAGCQTTSEEDSGSGYVRLVNDEGEVTHICRNEQTVGTNFKKRVCRTPEQMRLEEEAARRNMEDVQRARVRAEGMN